MKKRLYLSRKDKKLAGVCGGIAEYFDVDATVVRLLWVLFIFAGGSGIILYIIAALIMTEEPKNTFVEDYNEKLPETSVESETSEGINISEKENGDKSRVLLGIGLIVIGSMFFTKNFFFWNWFNYKFFLAAALIIGGIVVIVQGRK